MADEEKESQQGSLDDSSDSGSLMYVVCCRCHRFIEVRPGPIEAMTHTYCDACYKVMMEEIDDVLKTDEETTSSGSGAE